MRMGTRDYCQAVYLAANPRQRGGLPSIKRTLDWRAYDNELPWSSNNLINIHDDEQQSFIRQSGLWWVHPQSRLSDQNSLIMDMDQADRIINIHGRDYVTDHDKKRGARTHDSCMFIRVVNFSALHIHSRKKQPGQSITFGLWTGFCLCVIW